MKKLLLALLLVQLGACASLPNTPEELFTSPQRSPAFSYNASKEVTQNRIKNYLISCYGAGDGGGTTIMMNGGTAFFMPGARFLILEMHDGVVHRFAVISNMAGQHVLGTQIREGSDPQSSEMTVFAGNRFWRDRFSALNDAAAGKAASCPYR